MDLIALVLLTLVGYSVGATLGGWKRIVSPGLFDVVLIVALWTAALFSRAYLDKWAAVGAWLLIAGVCAAVWTSARRSQLAVDKQLPLPPAANALKRAWQAWMHFAQCMGNFQSRVMLTLFYFVIVTPFAILLKVFGDPLHLKSRSQPSFWLSRSTSETDLENARNQF